MSDDFVFYVYDDDPDDPRFSFWLETGDGGMSLYERPPDGQGMWLDPEPGSDYGAEDPSDELCGVVHDLIREGVDTDRVDDLPAHERHFVQVLSGTINEDENRLPSPVWHWMHTCEPQLKTDGGLRGPPGRRGGRSPEWEIEGGEGLPIAHDYRSRLKKGAQIWLFTCCGCGKRLVDPPGPPAGDHTCGGEWICHRFEPKEYSAIRRFNDPRRADEL